MIRNATIAGLVEYREGEGPLLTVPTGPCEVEATELDVTLSWTEGNAHEATAIPPDDFQRYVDSRSIILAD